MQSDGQVSPKDDHNSHMQDKSKAADVPLNRREVLKYGFGGLAAAAATPLISKFVRTPSSTSKGSTMSAPAIVDFISKLNPDTKWAALSNAATPIVAVAVL